MRETALGISGFKARCLSLIEEAAATGPAIVVTKATTCGCSPPTAGSVAGGKVPLV